MNEDSLSGLLLIVGLVIVQAIVTAAHAALSNARTGPLREQADDGNRRAAHILQLIGATNVTVTVYTVNTLIKFFIAAIAISEITAPLVEASGLSSGTLIAILMLMVFASLAIVLGDTVPEAIGSTYADQFVYGAAGIMATLMWVMSPMVLVLLKLSSLLSSLVRSSKLMNIVTEEEIMTLIDAGHTGGTIEDEEKDMIYSVLQLDQTHVSEMMVPRIDVTAVEINQTLDEARKLFVSSGFSRIPVYEDNLDTIRGLLYAKDLLAQKINGNADQQVAISDLMRPVYFVPETKNANELLKELQQQKVHIAIVVDEYGGTAGLVTIEDVIEEIIGDIQDEYDLHEEADYVQISETEYTVEASIDLDDFNALLEVDLPTEDSDTLGGYIYTYFGRVPLVDEVIELKRLHMRVLSVDGRRIRKVHVIRKEEDEEDEPLNIEPFHPEQHESNDGRWTLANGA